MKLRESVRREDASAEDMTFDVRSLMGFSVTPSVYLTMAGARSSQGYSLTPAEAKELGAWLMRWAAETEKMEPWGEAPSFVASVNKAYEATKDGRSELMAEILETIPEMPKKK